MERLSLEELVRRCQRTLPDDTRAFEELVTEFKQRVFTIAYRIIGNPQEAEDLSQEVFLKVYRHIKTLDDPTSVTTWISRITTNTCYDALTKKQRRPATVSLTMPDSADGEESYPQDMRTPTPEEVVLQRELRQCIERAFAELGITERMALVMRDVLNHSYQEIADILNLGLSAVKMRIHRSRVAFQHMLERVCPGVWPI